MGLFSQRFLPRAKRFCRVHALLQQVVRAVGLRRHARERLVRTAQGGAQRGRQRIAPGGVRGAVQRVSRQPFVQRPQHAGLDQPQVRAHVAAARAGAKQHLNGFFRKGFADHFPPAQPAEYKPGQRVFERRVPRPPGMPGSEQRLRPFPRTGADQRRVQAVR